MIDLVKGILFEESGEFLEWGKNLDKLGKIYNAKKDVRDDRTIYYWGEHSILNGLNLDLSSMYWIDEDNLSKSVFESIEYWAIGDEMAKESFEMISKHLLTQFGEPTKKDEPEEVDKSWTWFISGATLRLYFFEQHCYKLSFTIKIK